MAGEIILTEAEIARRTGFKLGIMYPSWDTNGAGIVQYGEDLNIYGQELGWTNVIGSFYVDGGQIALGLFFRKDQMIEASARERSTTALPSAFTAIEQNNPSMVSNDSISATAQSSEV